MDGGVLRETHKLIGMREPREVACAAVRGKPSRMKDAEGSSDSRGGGKVSVREGVLTNSSIELEESAEQDVLDKVRGLEDAGKSHPRDLSSWRMSLKIISSGTRAPARMADSALIPGDLLVCGADLVENGFGVVPRGVLFFTLFLSRSPELMAES